MPDLEPSMTQPTILRTDPRFLIVNKPAGWLVHPTRPDGTFTLIDWLREQLPGEFLSLVSRLDRETSGLLLVARGKENASLLGKMQQRREILKTYLAIVHGQPPESGIIDAALDRLGKHQLSRIYIRQAVVPGTYPAVTEFKTLGTRPHPEHAEISLVEASPKTGRLHQIRAHFEHLGFPVLNDKIYGKDDEYFINYIDKDFKNCIKICRHCLHSSKIVFKLGEERVAEEIGLPADMSEIWDLGRADRPQSPDGQFKG
ncbi:MAG: RNA pseudouridine synthase [Verrucomicrobia bacterium]|nr:RNA pseudouridine synthase [Verrucomicrobiota bacterium]